MPAEKGNTYAQKYTDEDIHKLGKLLIEFVEDPETVHFAEFCRKYKKPISWLAMMSTRRPLFKEYYELANNLMTAKYVKACITNKWNATFGEKYLPIYDKQYKDLLKWKAEIQKETIHKEENKCAFNEWKEQQKGK